MKGKRLMAGFLSLMLSFSTMTSTSYATEFAVEDSGESYVTEIEESADFFASGEVSPIVEAQESKVSAVEEIAPAAEIQDSEVFTSDGIANDESLQDSANVTFEQQFSGSLENMDITVEAPESAFPAGTAMSLTEPHDTVVQAAANAVNADSSDVEAVDITFTAGNEEIEPNVAVKVSMKYSRAVNTDQIKVVHVNDNEQAEIIETVEIDTENQTVSFEAASFSAYAIVYVPDSGNEEEKIALHDEKDNYIFQINYIFADGTTAAQPYSGTFANGSSYSTTVNNPEILGYEATAPTTIPEGVTVEFSSEALSYSFESISRDIILNVVYTPAEVKYKVEYYHQNVNDDGYTLYETEEKNGYTDSVVSETYEKTKDKYSGFYGLRFETPTIAADGSTVVEIKYDRSYYMLSFDLDGGYGVEPVYARYGTPIGEVGSPVRAGYTFNGWDQDIPDTMPAQNLTITAMWNGQSASYAVVYWYENADDDGYSPMGSSTRTAAIGASDNSYAHRNDNFTGRDTSHFTYNGNLNETVSIAADGSTVLNVYFTRNTYTFTFKNNSRTIYSVTAKYNSDISNIWNFTGSDGKTYPQTNPVTSWKPSGSTTYTVRITHMERMPGENITFTHTTSSNGTRYFNYYVESLNGTTGDKEYRNRQYDLYLELPNDFAIMYYNDDFFLLDGFTRQTITQIGNNGRESDFNLNAGENERTNKGRTYNFYYTRNSYDLSFYNVTAPVSGHGGSVQYQAPLESYDFTPEMPNIYEAGAMRFDGWYLNSECSGNRVDLSSRTMPAANLRLYAKWIPVSHNVNVYKSEGGERIGDTQVVSHGSVAVEPETPTNGSYTFIGWFYRDTSGVEKAFDFSSMPIRRDMEIYAKWGSNVLKDYTIKYILEDGTEIADSTIGSALAGTTKTFEAKTGEALNDGYTEGYFPVKKSHSLVIDIDNDANNEYSFVYKEAQSVPYRVKYVDAETNQEIAADKVVSDNRRSVVTETAATVSGYLPDNYQKRLVISYSEADEPTEENTLIFYYTKDEVHALVVDTHYILPLNSNNESLATEYQQNQETGTIGKEYTRNAMQIENYVLDHVKVNGETLTEEEITSVTRTLSGHGLVFEFYYRPEVFYVWHSSTGVKEAVAMYEVHGTYDITKKVPSSYYYGGYYSKYNKSEETVYPGGTGYWTKKNAITGERGDVMTPVAGETYYLKEVPAAYLRPYLHIVYNEYYGNVITGMYLITGVDDANYQEIGLDVRNITLNTMRQVSKVTVQASAAQGETTITTQTAFGVKGFLGVWDQTNVLKENYEFTYTPYFITPDGVKVVGRTVRLVNTGDKHYYNTFDQGDNNPGIYRKDS